MNFYEVLGIKTNATEKDIKKAYRVLAKKYHPDTYKGNKEFAVVKMQEINVAYDTLSDNVLRNKYDEKIGVNRGVNSDNTSTKSQVNTNSYYRNRYDKSGVNYNVKYSPNNSKVKYDKEGYAEANYYTSEMDEQINYNKYKKINFKDVFIRKKITSAVFVICIAVFAMGWMLYKAYEAMNDIITTTQEVSEKINSSKVEREKSTSENNREELKEEITQNFDEFLENLKTKRNEISEKNNKIEIMEQWGITDAESQQRLLDFINELKNAEN